MSLLYFACSLTILWKQHTVRFPLQYFIFWWSLHITTCRADQCFSGMTLDTLGTYQLSTPTARFFFPSLIFLSKMFVKSSVSTLHCIQLALKKLHTTLLNYLELIMNKAELDVSQCLVISLHSLHKKKISFILSTILGKKKLSHTTHVSKHWFGDLQAKMHLDSISSFKLR